MREVREKLVEQLVELGLTLNEAKVYVALIELGTATPSDIATLSGVPVSKIYYILSELERKGIAESQQGKPKLYRAIEPSRALKILLEKYIEARKKAMKLFNMLESRERRRDARSMWIIRGRKNILNRLRVIIRSSKISLVAASTDEVLSLLSRDLLDAINRDVNISMVIYRTIDKNTRLLLDRFKDKAVVKVRDMVAPSMLIADDKVGIAYIMEALYRASGGAVETALLIEDEEFLPIFSSYFRFFIWYPSKLITPLDEFLSRPRTYCVYYRAVEDAKYLLSKGVKLRARVDGWYIAGGERRRVSLEGDIVDTYESESRTVYNITLVTDSGNKLLLGGKRCVIEDVETEKITLIPIL